MRIRGASACTWRAYRRSAAASSPIRCSCSPAAPGRPRAPSTPPSPGRSRASTATATSCSSTSAAPAARTCSTARSRPRRCTANPTRRLPSTPAPASPRSPRAPRSPTTPPASRCRTWSRCARALGYERINLYGVSYGTRVAQHYMRRFPQRVRAVILDGVVPPQLAIGPAVALDAENALRAVLARCAAQAPCRESFKDPQDDYRALRASAAKGPGARAAAGSCQWRAAAAGLRQRPAGDGAAPGELFVRLRGAAAAAAAQRARARGLHAACRAVPADPALLRGRRHRHAQQRGVRRGRALLRHPRHRPRRSSRRPSWAPARSTACSVVCGVWPRGPVDADFHAPLHSAVPALLLSGSDDPVTPPAYARAGAPRASRTACTWCSQGFGHGQLDRALRRPADGAASSSVPEPPALDVSCTAQARGRCRSSSPLNGPAP